MKKRITLFVLVLVLFSFFSRAQQISIGTVTACVGDTILVPVQMSNITYLGAINLFIEYNGGVLVFNGIVNINPQTPILSGVGLQNPTRVGLMWTAFGLGWNFTAGKLCDLRFIYNGGTSNLTVSAISEVANYDGIPIAMTYIPGQVYQNYVTIDFAGLGSLYCENSPPSLLSGTPTGGAFSGPGIVGSSFDPSLATAGTHEIVYTYIDVNNCVFTISYTTTVFAMPIVNLGSDVTVCDGNSVTLDAGLNLFYYWSNGSTNQMISALPGTFSVTVINGYTCLNSDTITITTYPDLQVNNISENCTSSNSNYKVYFDISGGDPASYTVIDNFTGLPTGTLLGGLFESDLIASTSVYSLSVFDSNACDTILVEGIHDCGQIITLIVDLGPDQVLCEGDTTTLNAGVFASYLWSTGETGQSIAVVLTGQYSVTVSDGLGNAMADTVLVSFNPLPIVDLGPDTNLCNNQTLILYGGTYESYLWSNGGTNSMLFVSSNPGNFSVTVTAANGCTATDDVNIDFIPAPYVNLGPDTTLCLNQTLILYGGTYESYLWSNGGTNSMLFVSANPGNFSVTVTAANGCTATDDVNIDFIPAPYVNLGPDTTLCLNQTLILYGGTQESYLWSNGGTNSMLFVSANPGNFSVTVTAANGCTATDDVNIDFIPAPFVDLGPDVTVCLNQTHILYGGYQESYLWSNGGTNSMLFVSAHPGNFSITVTSANGCTATDNVNIDFIPAPFVNLGPDVAICEGDSTTLSGGNFTNFLWSTGATTQNITVANPATYLLTVTYPNGCAGSDAVNVYFNSLLAVDLGPDIIDTVGNMVSLNAGSFANYLWSTGETSAVISVDTSGNYAVTVSDGSGCQQSDDIFVEFLPLNSSPPTITSMSPDNNTLLENWHDLFIATQDTDNDVEYLEVHVVKSTFPGDSVDWVLWNIPVDPLDLAAFNSSYSGIVEGSYIANTFKQSINTFALADTALGFPGWGTGTFTFWYIVHDSQGLQSGNWGIPSAPIDHRSYLMEEVIVDAHHIFLPEGFSIFSTYIDPDDPNIADVLDSITQEIVIVKDGDGNPYWPQYGINNIGNMDIGQGYQVKLNSAQDIWIVGELIDPVSNPIYLTASWNLLGYLRTSPASMADMMQSIDSYITLAKNSQGDVYWPFFNLNIIGDMMPGEGYKIRLVSAVTLVYPSNTISYAKATESHQEPVHFKCAKASCNMTLGIPMTAWESLPGIGDEIGVSSSSGKLVGSAVFTGKDMALAIWGVDNQLKKDGLIENETFILKHWNQKTGAEAQISVDYFDLGDALYECDKISVIGSLKRTEVLYSNRLYECYPNPTSNLANIRFQIDNYTFADVFLSDETGKKVISIFHGSLPAGNYYFELGTYNLPSGNYFIVFKSDRFEDTQKLVIVH
ncbi:MAG: T9SS type A sorting domain-containing protein [Bacteroidales bacterium]|nr:T9SS type A sorting domain-containing protein [Bacteroidales bacterium]MCF8456678.1 T9SS type A sorting domain-containing protein [Bacteroidales bacterium]